MYIVHGDNMCDQFEYLSVIRGHHIYAHAPLESHSRAEENPTMTLRSLTWPDPSLRRGFIVCSIYAPASNKHPAREYRGWLRETKFCCGYC